MNKIFIAFLIAMFSLFTSSVFAEGVINMKGKGTPAHAIQVFENAITNIGGFIDSGSKTEFSSSGEMDRDFVFRINVQKLNNNEVFLVITVVQKKADLLTKLSGQQSSLEEQVGGLIYPDFRRAGYYDWTPPK